MRGNEPPMPGTASDLVVEARAEIRGITLRDVVARPADIVLIDERERQSLSRAAALVMALPSASSRPYMAFIAAGCPLRTPNQTGRLFG